MGEPLRTPATSGAIEEKSSHKPLMLRTKIRRNKRRHQDMKAIMLAQLKNYQSMVYAIKNL
jgi:hypothetical protein